MNYPLLLLFWTLWYIDYLARVVLSPLMPVIEDALLLNHAMAGGLYLPFYTGSTLSVLAGGFLSLRFVYKKPLLSCFIILTIGFFILGFVRDYYLFMVVSFFLGAGSGLYIPCGIPMLTAVIPKSFWGRAISIHETAAGCAILTIPFITAFSLSWMTWYATFWLMAGGCFAAILLIYAFSPDPQPFEEKKSSNTGILHRKQFWMLLIVFVTCGIASMGVFNIVPLYLVKEKGLPVATANTLFGISRAGGFIAMILIGLVIDRFSLRKMFIAIIFLTGLSTISIAMIENSLLLIVMLVIQATFSVVFFPVGLTVVSRVTTQRERGIFTGIVMSGAGIVGPGLSPIVLGAVADRYSFAIGIFAVGVLTTLSTIFVRNLETGSSQ